MLAGLSNQSIGGWDHLGNQEGLAGGSARPLFIYKMGVVIVGRIDSRSVLKTVLLMLALLRAKIPEKLDQRAGH